MSRLRHLASLLSWLSLVTVCTAQGPGAQMPGGQVPGGKKSPNPSSAGGTTASVSGVAYAAADFPTSLPPSPVAVLCYKLTPLPSSVQPLVLEKTTIFNSCTGEVRPEAKSQCSSGQSTWTPCSSINDATPLSVGSELVVAIDVNGTDIGGLQLLNLNVTNQQAAPNTPSPLVGNSMVASAVTNGAESQGPILYLPWPFRIAAGVIPQLTVMGVYAAPLPGAPWRKGTIYPAGSIVIARPDNGHFFIANQGGRSNSSQPSFSVLDRDTTPDGNIIWQEAGTTNPNPPSAPADTMITLLNETLSPAVAPKKETGHSEKKGH
jgi:hypothetical protein